MGQQIPVPPQQHHDNTQHHPQLLHFICLCVFGFRSLDFTFVSSRVREFVIRRYTSPATTQTRTTPTQKLPNAIFLQMLSTPASTIFPLLSLPLPFHCRALPFLWYLDLTAIYSYGEANMVTYLTPSQSQINPILLYTYKTTGITQTTPLQ